MALVVFVAVLGDEEKIVVADSEAVVEADAEAVVVEDEETIVVVLFVVVVAVEVNYRGCCCRCLQFPAMEPVVVELLVLV